MPCDELPDNLKILWKEVGTNPSMFTAEQLRRETSRLQTKRRKGQIAVVACMLVLAASYGASFFLFPNTLARLGGALTVIVCGYWLVHALMVQARAATDPGETDGLCFYRAELEQARDNHRWMSWRFLLLLGPFILFDIGVAQIYAKVWPLIVWFACLDCALLMGVLAVWAPVTHFRLAKKYQDLIVALNAASGSGQAQRKH
jgi:hypothetical protein